MCRSESADGVDGSAETKHQKWTRKGGTLFYEENEAAWRNYLNKSAHPDYLHGWNYDTKVLSENLYDLRITPMMILVDANKKVVAKDVLPAQLEQLMIDIAKKN